MIRDSTFRHLIRWRKSINGNLRPLTHRAFVHLEAHEADKVFDATLFLKKREFTSKNLLGLLLQTPR